MGPRCLIGVSNAGVTASSDSLPLSGGSAGRRRRIFNGADNQSIGGPPACAAVSIRIFDEAHPRERPVVIEEPGHPSNKRRPSVPTSMAKPSSIASGRSVVSRITSTGFSKEGASS